jgi:hypothetical protein
MLTDEDLEKIKRLIDESVSGLKSDVSSLKSEAIANKQGVAKLTDAVEALQKFAKNYSYGIETEINKAAEEYFKLYFEGYDVVALNIKYLLNPTNKEQITEFDGVYMAKPRTRTKDYTLVIIEAKNLISIPKINKKILQLSRIVKYLESAKDYKNGKPDPGWTEGFKNDVDRHSFDQVNHIDLFIGGPVWEENASGYIEKINAGTLLDTDLEIDKMSSDQKIAILAYLKNHLHRIIPVGKRYAIPSTILPSLGGGQRRTQRQPKIYISKDDMVIFPNHLNVKYL